MGRKQRRTFNNHKDARRAWSLPQTWVRWLAIALLLAGGIRYWDAQQRVPDAVLVLGGAEEREQFAADFAQDNPDLPIWVSSGSNPEYAEWIFEEAGISDDRVHLDYRAVDTVTNFTTLVQDFKTAGFDCVYVVTSDYHMRRARTIGRIVFGSQGIHFDPITVETGKAPEPLKKTLRDGVRSLLWVTTGRTGLSLGQVLLNERLIDDRHHHTELTKARQ